MARTSATISVGADTRQLEKDIQSALSRDFKFKGFNEKVFTQPLGRITGAANEFQKSLDASNARVIAFGASAGLIYTVEKAFASLVKSTIDVQKSLTDINVILNVSAKTLDQFGSSLFDIAKNTGQSFDVVAQAATELSRQGLGLEETLKRTQDALILTRLSGLDTVSAVEALTATINSFNKVGLDSTVIINKLANVDAAFAVSSGDLAEAIKRVGSSASDAGVGFDELLAIVTSVQQTTARGGAVIGNSLKTIFTRIQRTETLDQLEQLGIKVRDLEGNTLPAIQVLSNLSNTFNQLGDSQRAQVAETVGGVFQINILRAALADLGKQYSVYDRALQTASNSTDQAIQRNEALNQTLSALINQTFQNLTRISSDIGKISLGPTFKGTLELLNKGLESLSTDSDSVGGKIGKGILEGIGTFISGPGVILLTAVFGKLLLNLGKFASQSLQTLLSVNTQAEQRVQIQAKINEVLAQEPGLVAAIYSKQISVLELENRILDVIRLQTLERERATTISTSIAGNLVNRGVTSKGGSLKVKSAGFIPNFNAQEIYGALAGGYTPGNIRKMNIPGQGNVTYNSAETVKNFPGMTQPAIMPPQGSKAGKNYQKQFSSAHGFNPYANKGFIPNFASYNINGQYYKNAAAVGNAIFKGKITKEVATKAGYVSTEESNLLKSQKKSNFNSIFSPTPLLALNKQGSKDGYTFRPAGKPPLDVRFPVVGFNRNSVGFNLDSLKENLDTVIDKSITDFANSIYQTRKITPPIDLPSTIKGAKQKSEGLAGAIEGTIGGIFESAFRAAFGRSVKASSGGTFDVNSIPKDLPLFFPGTPIGVPGDFKNSDSSGNRESMAFKILRTQRPDLLKFLNNKNAASGFIPNFTALDTAIGREVAAGTSTSRIRIGKDARLTSSTNPLGLGVYNTKDEPMGLSQGIQRYGSKAKMAGAAAGFIPNFAGLSFNPGGLGALDPTVANKEIGAQFGKILGKLKAQEITIDQANVSLRGLSSMYGLAADSQNRFNQILQSRGSQYATSAKNAAIAMDKTKTSFETFSKYGLALSIALPIAVQTVSQFNEKNKKAQIALDAFGTFLSLTAAGATLGAPGAVVAGGIGAGIAVTQFLQGMKDIKLGDLDQDLQLVIDKYNDTSTSLNKILPLLEKYKEIQSSSLPDLQKTEALSDVQNQITENLSKTGPAIVDGVTEALKKQDWTQAAYILNKGIAEASAEANNSGIKTLFEKARINRSIESKSQATAISKALTGGVTSSGKNIIQDFASKPENLPVMENVSKDLYKLLTERGKLQENQSRNQTMMEGFSMGLASEDPELRRKVQKEILDTEILLKTNLQNIVKKTEPLYQATDESRAYFEEISQLSKDTGLSIAAADIIIKDTKNYIDSTRKTAKKVDLIFKTEGINNLQEYIAAFKNGKLNAKNAQEYYKKLFANQNPKDILAKNEDALNMSVQTTFLNKSSQDKVLDQLTIEQEKLRAKLANRQITEDQYNKALDGLKDKIILEQRRQGTIFAEDFRSGRQSARESRALAGQTKLSDFSGAFFDEFDQSAADSFREVQLGAKDTANTMKSEFNNAFLSFANGTATAGDAFTKMALNISDKIQQLALEFSTNLLFSKLMGSTSNIFGGGGGGGFNFGSLFGFNKGGIVKGYSSGGTVTGGSGTRDDVPAMLSGGEYVVKKSAVNKYGTNFLETLNNRGLGKFADGGGLQNTFENTYTYNDPFRPTTGARSIDSNLSLQAIADENNPMNRVRAEREMDLLNYIKYVEDIDSQNKENEKAYWERKFEEEKSRLEAWQQEQRRRQEMENQYNEMQKKRQQGNWYKFGFGLLGVGASFFKDGGQVKKFAKGGKSEDDVPAMLMDGEFIMRKEAVGLYGKKFFDELNNGRIKKFADGGSVGYQTGAESSQDMGSSTSNNNINITVNVTKEGNTSEQSDSDAKDRDTTEKERQKTKVLAEKVKVQVLKVITEQQRPGGLLYKSR
jgi:TP901 family phage tail tape measure protein